MFDNNGSYNIFAMAFAAKERPDRQRGYEVIHHQPCGDGGEDPDTAQAQIDLENVPAGSLWRTRRGLKAEHTRYKRNSTWPAVFEVELVGLSEKIKISTTRFGRASSDEANGFPDHEWDIMGPWAV